jgi:hypothetical protein
VFGAYLGWSDTLPLQPAIEAGNGVQNAPPREPGITIGVQSSGILGHILPKHAFSHSFDCSLVIKERVHCLVPSTTWVSDKA